MLGSRYKIWWSPVGYENGSMDVFALSQADAEHKAKVEMRKRCGIGAYGAILVDDGTVNESPEARA